VASMIRSQTGLARNHAERNSYRFTGYTASGVYLRYTLNAQNGMRRGTTSEKLK